MASTAIYREILKGNYDSLYLEFGLKDDNGVSLQLPLYEYLVDSRKAFKFFLKSYDTKTQALQVLDSYISEIAKLNDTLSFSHIGILDFQIYERIDYLLDLVLSYKDVNYITDYMAKEIKELIEYITFIENNSGPDLKNTLSYMTIRNFLMFLVNKKFLYASCYATFIKEQIFLSEGLNPRIEFSDLYKSELSLTIKKERARYSNKIRKQVKNSVKNIVKKTVTNNNNPSQDSKIDKIKEVIKDELGDTSKTLKDKKYKGKIISIKNRDKEEISLNDLKEVINSKVNDREEGNVLKKDILNNSVTDSIAEIVNNVKTKSKIKIKTYSTVHNSREVVDVKGNVIDSKLDNVDSDKTVVNGTSSRRKPRTNSIPIKDLDNTSIF